MKLTQTHCSKFKAPRQYIISVWCGDIWDKEWSLSMIEFPTCLINSQTIQIQPKMKLESFLIYRPEGGGPIRIAPFYNLTCKNSIIWGGKKREKIRYI